MYSNVSRMTVDELRKALEGLPGDMFVAICGEFIEEPYEALPTRIRLNDDTLGIGSSYDATSNDPLYFLIS